MSVLVLVARLCGGLAAIAILAGVQMSSAQVLDLPQSWSPPYAESNTFALTPASRVAYLINDTTLVPPFPISSRPFVAALYPGASATMEEIIERTRPSVAGRSVPIRFFTGSLASGGYREMVSRQIAVSGFEAYGGLLSAAAPVVAPMPERELWPMIIVGAGLIGLRLRTKGHVGSARRFT